MARIATYQNDELINDNDRLIGTDGGQIGSDGMVISGTTGRTRNFTIGALRAYITSRGADAATSYNTVLLTDNPDDELGLATAYTVYQPGGNIVMTLPTVGTNGGAIQGGSWLRISFIGNTGGMIFAGSANTALTAPGDRFMAGIAADGNAAADPHLLVIQQNNEVAFELIYVANPITIGGVTAPVGWIIVN